MTNSMPAMHVAFLSEHASPLALLGGEDAGGQNVYVDAVSRQLAASGIAVDIYTRRDSVCQSEVVVTEPRIRVIHLNAGPPRYVPKDELWPYMPDFQRELLHFAERYDAHYALVHGNFWMSGWVAANIGQQLKIPAVQIFHAMGRSKRREQGDADTSPSCRIAIEQEIIERVDQIIAQCPGERDELIGDYGATADKVTLIPSAVDPNLFSPRSRGAARRRIGLDTAGTVIAYVGRMLPRKDVRNIVRALAILRTCARARNDARLDARLVVVGGETTEPDALATPELGVLQQLAEEVGVSDRVIFTGKRLRRDLRDYYCASNVAVTTPWYEPFGLTPLEAMACGCPVIGSRVGGIAFTVEDGATGYLVPPRDPVALAKRLEHVLTHPLQARRMGQAARRRVEEQFTWDRVGDRTASLYRRLLSSSEHVPATLDRSDEFVERSSAHA
jgi:D-inositol-3-phosphate glycosyltransferase